MWDWLFGKKEEETPYSLMLTQGKTTLEQSNKMTINAQKLLNDGYSSNSEFMLKQADKLRAEGLKIIEQAEELRWKYAPDKQYQDTGKIYR